MERFQIAEKDQKYLIAFYIEGIGAVIKKWVNNDCKENIEDIENLIIRCVNKI